MTYLNASNPESYSLMESFYTIQGEGSHAGRAAFFIRLGGCDVRCWWCDVKESWDAAAHPEMDAADIARLASESGANLAVITGGEPLLHDLTALSRELHRQGLEIHLETSGSSPLCGEIDWVTLSPKRFKVPIDEIFPVVDELKVVVLTKKDLAWAEENESRCSPETLFSLQPEWDTPASIPLIIEYVKEHPQWKVSLQTHKFMQIP